MLKYSQYPKRNSGTLIGKGFTIVELLVTMAIVSLLIALLLPSLGAARSSAIKQSCAVNLRSNGQVLMMYSNDNKDYLPDHGTTSGNGGNTGSTCFALYNSFVFRTASSNPPLYKIGLFDCATPTGVAKPYSGTLSGYMTSTQSWMCPNVPTTAYPGDPSSTNAVSHINYMMLWQEYGLAFNPQFKPGGIYGSNQVISGKGAISCKVVAGDPGETHVMLGGAPGYPVAQLSVSLKPGSDVLMQDIVSVDPANGNTRANHLLQGQTAVVNINNAQPGATTDPTDVTFLVSYAPFNGSLIGSYNSSFAPFSVNARKNIDTMRSVLANNCDGANMLHVDGHVAFIPTSAMSELGVEYPNVGPPNVQTRITFTRADSWNYQY